MVAGNELPVCYSQGILFVFVFFFFLFFFLFFFFFKQKTAYEIGTGDWSSDVCSSDLLARLDSIGQPTDKSIDDSLNERLEGITGEISEVTIKRWKVFKENMIMDSASNFTKKLDSD